MGHRRRGLAGAQRGHRGPPGLRIRGLRCLRSGARAPGSWAEGPGPGTCWGQQSERESPRPREEDGSARGGAPRRALDPLPAHRGSGPHGRQGAASPALAGDDGTMGRRPGRPACLTVDAARLWTRSALPAWPARPRDTSSGRSRFCPGAGDVARCGGDAGARARCPTSSPGAAIPAVTPCLSFPSVEWGEHGTHGAGCHGARRRLASA